MTSNAFRDLGIRRRAQQGVLFWSEKSPAGLGHTNLQAGATIFHRTERSAELLGDFLVAALFEKGVLIGCPLVADNLPNPQHPPPDEDGRASALKLPRSIIDGECAHNAVLLNGPRTLFLNLLWTDAPMESRSAVCNCFHGGTNQ